MTDLQALARDIRKARAEAADDLYRTRIEAFGDVIGLDDAILAGMASDDAGLDAAPVSMKRDPVTLGMGSFWLSRIDVTLRDGTTSTVMEKAVEAGGPEAQFWARAKAEGYQLAGERFASVGPLFSVETEPITILYMPYLDDLHRSKVASKRNYRSNIEDLARAVAEFNASNVVDVGSVGAGSEGVDERRIVKTRDDAPSIDDIGKWLSIESRHAARILREACLAIDARWDEMEQMYDAAPVCLSHNDIGPGNAIVTSGHAHLLDFEKAGLSPVGSDMHTLLRWGGKCLEDEAEAERLLAVYVDEFRRIRPDVSARDIRVGAWVTFFIRYSSIAKWRSARNLDSFSLALLKAGALLDSEDG